MPRDRAYSQAARRAPIPLLVGAVHNPAVEVKRLAAKIHDFVNGLTVQRIDLSNPLKTPSASQVLPHRLHDVRVSLLVTIVLMPAASARSQVSLIRLTV